MEQAPEQVLGEVLYEIRHHAKISFSSESFQEEVGRSSRGGFLSYLSLKGAKQLKEKWIGYNQPKSLKKLSIFASVNGEYVALAVGNQIIILKKDDDYMEPIGTFISNDRSSLFKSGAWMEPQGILVVLNDMNNILFIKSNGEEIARRTKSQLKLSVPVVDLIVLSDLNSEKLSWICFYMVTVDGFFHHVELTHELSAEIYVTPNNIAEKRQLPNNVACMDFHPDLSLVALVSASTASANSGGLYSLHLVRIISKSEVEILSSSSQFEGLFLTSEGSSDTYTSPKVAISPYAKYIASLDMTGCVDVFNLDAEKYSVSCISAAETQYSNKIDNSALGKKDILCDIVDISWWSEDILVLAKRGGNITMYNVLRGRKVVDSALVVSKPVIERMKHRQGHVFVMEGRPSDESKYEHKEDNKNHQLIEQMAYSDYNQHGKFDWRLMSLTEKSISEMYTILISNRDYEAALDFARRHRLDKDEVYKAQWLQSDQGVQQIDVFLTEITDLKFVLSECVDKVGQTEDSVKALISYGLHITDDYRFPDSEACEPNDIWDFRVIRLQLLQYRDKLETFVGINMGRFSSQDYRKFRVVTLAESAITLAESGKIGSLNLLFRRHPYSLSPHILDILSAIPETVAVQSYSQLLPGRSPPSITILRDADWVECEKMVHFINKLPTGYDKLSQITTEFVLKYSSGLSWPSVSELSDWYKKRTRDIDNLSGQLDNCLTLLEFACRKGIVELQQFHDDISYLHKLIYSHGCDGEFVMSLVEWEELSDYEKFRIMLKGVKEDHIVETLQERAIPFMKTRFQSESVDSQDHEQKDSFLVRWLKEIAADNNLDVCLVVIESGCGDHPLDDLFKDDAEMIETALNCIYLCSLTDQWNMMAAILSKLPRKFLKDKGNKDFNPSHGSQDIETSRFSFIRSQHAKPELPSVSLRDEDFETPNSRGFEEEIDDNELYDNLEKRIKMAEGHVEVGRLLAYYQVPKPISFLLDAQSDEKNVKQLIRLILSKFGRRQPGRPDNDWASMWRDMLCFQQKAFPFLETEYMLIEFCRGLLKAGKFSLARNYLKGTGSVSLSTETAESLVIQAAREYFFSASSLSCSEIWKARECLSLFPNSKNVQAEADIIDALTTRLPNLGVTLLPMQFKQIRNPMEIINTVISGHTGAYLNVEELIEIAKLLGLSSQDDISAVEEAIAREAAVAGDLQLAFDMCLVLAKKSHGPVWDLCAAIARGPQLDNMDTSSRKHLLGFALSYCDDESIGELLQAWKDVDICMQCEKLMVSSQSTPPNFYNQGSSYVSLPISNVEDIFHLRESSETIKYGSSFQRDGCDYEIHFKDIKDILSTVGKELLTEDGVCWDYLLKENRKFLSFAALELPWLLELSRKEETSEETPGLNIPASHCNSERMQAIIIVLYWLSMNDIPANDSLIASLAKLAMEPPVTEENDVLGCSFLLNLTDAIRGVEIIEEQLKQRGHQEMHNIMNMGMAYSSLQNLQKDCSSPDDRRQLLLHKFQEKNASLSSDKLDDIDEAHSAFWREWKMKLKEQKRIASEARELELIIPGIETSRFLSGDTDYIRSILFSFIDSIQTEKKHILKEAVNISDKYGLNRTEVLLRFFGSALVSDCWDNADILEEILEFREDIVKCAKGVTEMISSAVYPVIDGHNKQRLSYIYGILSACNLHLRKEDPRVVNLTQQTHMFKHKIEPFQFYKVLEQECQKVSYISGLNFKNIAALDDLNFDNFNEEISSNINQSTVDTLANMVRTLACIYDDNEATRGLISPDAVYKHHILDCLTSLEGDVKEISMDYMAPDELQSLIEKVELKYESCKQYVRYLPEAEQLHIVRRYCLLCIPPNPWRPNDDTTWKTCLMVLLSFWIKMFEDEGIGREPLARCLDISRRLLGEDKFSALQGWTTIIGYITSGFKGSLTTEIICFLRSMILSGCDFDSVAGVCYEAQLTDLTPAGMFTNIVDLYIDLIDKALLDLSNDTRENQDLHCMLTSLSKFDEGCNFTEDLKIIRSHVWGKLSAYSNDMELASQLRVYALELMQSITGQNVTSLPAKLVSEVKAWEAWEHSYFTTNSSMSLSQQDESSASNITSTLIALKTTQLVASISPDLKITAEDLGNIDSAVSCFLHMSEASSSPSHLHILQAVLEEWEVLFSSGGTDDEVTASAASPSSAEDMNWNSDGWDNEGWEDLPEEDPIKTEKKQDVSRFIRPLHTCWMAIIRRLVGISQPTLAIQLLDQSLTKIESAGVLLDEDEAQQLYQLVVGVDCFVAIKMLLLLPYKEPQVQCLGAIAAKLRESAGTPTSACDHELLTLILSSGILEDILINPNFSTVFSYLCHMVGNLAHLAQEDMLKYKRGDEKYSSERKGLLMFGKLLMPCFISVLVQSGQSLLAGFIISRWMHTHPSFGLIDVAEASLRKYLEGQLSQIQQSGGCTDLGDLSCGSLLNSVSLLTVKMENLVDSAISLLAR